MSGRILIGPEFIHPVDDSTLGYFFFNNAQKYHERICQIDGTTDQSETYASVKLRSTRAAIAMRKRGVTFNDNVAFCSANTIDNTIPILAAFYLGARVACLEPSLSLRHTQHLLTLVTPKKVFVEESALALIEKSLIGANFDTEIVVFGQSDKYTHFSDLVVPQEDEEEFRPVDVDVEDIALMLFSSGTTGLPKAICHSHRSFLCVMLQIFQVGVRNSVFHSSSLYWISAWVMITSCFKSGSSRIFASTFDAENVLRIVDKYKVHCIFSAPILTYQLTSFENSSKYDTSSIKLYMCAGTPMAPSQIQKVNELFPTAVTILICGMSEMGVVSSFDMERDRELLKRKNSSCGKPAPGVLMKIVDPDTEELLAPNQKGEIRLKAPSMMKGYYRGDASQAFDKDDFLKTGDIGYYDEDECVYVIARIKEMFKYQSWHIIPSSIEAVLLEHPGIKETVVFGLPGGEDGEVPAACIILEDGFTLSEEQIDAFLKEKIADRERLRGGITFVQDLPKTPTGKVIRREVRKIVIKSKSG